MLTQWLDSVMTVPYFNYEALDTQQCRMWKNMNPLGKSGSLYEL